MQIFKKNQLNIFGMSVTFKKRSPDVRRTTTYEKDLSGPVGDMTDVEIVGSLYLSMVVLRGQPEVPSQLKVHWEAGG